MKAQNIFEQKGQLKLLKEVKGKLKLLTPGKLNQMMSEGGLKAAQVLAALEEAGDGRGVRVLFSLDVSYVSIISRIIERTDTLLPRVEALSDRAWCSCVYL